MKRTIYQLPFDLIPAELPSKDGGTPVKGALLRFVNEPGHELLDFPMDEASLQELHRAVGAALNKSDLKVVTEMPSVLRRNGT